MGKNPHLNGHSSSSLFVFLQEQSLSTHLSPFLFSLSLVYMNSLLPAIPRREKTDCFAITQPVVLNSWLDLVCYGQAVLELSRENMA